MVVARTVWPLQPEQGLWGSFTRQYVGSRHQRQSRECMPLLMCRAPWLPASLGGGAERKERPQLGSISQLQQQVQPYGMATAKLVPMLDAGG
jgi:hypothetical protein